MNHINAAHSFTEKFFAANHRARFIKRAFAAAAISTVALLGSHAQAANGADTWTGASATWNTGGNWTGANTPPISGDSLVFGAAGAGGTTLTDNLTTGTSTWTVAGITFNSGASAFTITPSSGSNGFTLTSGITNNSNVLQTINDNIAFSGTDTMTMTTGGGNISLGGVLSGSGSLTTAGTGTLFIPYNATNNTYSGGTTIANNTTIAIGNSGATANPSTGTYQPLGTGTVTINTGGNLELGSIGSFSTVLTYGNAVNLNGGTLWTFDGVNHLTGNVSVSAASILSASFSNKDLFIDGALSGSGNLTVQDAAATGGTASFDGSNVHFTNSGTSTYSGTITINPYNNGGGAGGSYLEIDAANALAAATLNLTGNNGGANEAHGNGVLLFGNYSPYSVTAATIGGLSGSGSFVLGQITSATGNPSTTAGVALTVNENGTTTYSGVMSGAGSLILGGTGTLTLSSANTYTGSTTLNSGGLALDGSTGAAGTGTLTLAGGTLLKTGGSNVALTTSNTINATGTTVVSAQNTGNWTFSNSVIGSGTINVSNGVSPAATTIIFSGNLSGFTGTFAQTTGNNRLRFGSSGTGQTVDLSQASVVLSGSTSSGNPIDLADGFAGTVKIGALSGTGGILRAGFTSGSGNNTTFQVGAMNTPTSFAGSIQDNPTGGGGLSLLTKVGTSSLTLSGPSSYTGTTTVENGSLIAGAAVAVSTSGPFGNSSAAIALGDATTISSSTAMNPQLLIGGAFTVARGITVGASNAALGNAGTTFTIGGNTANSSTFSGAETLNQSLIVTQLSGGTLNLTGNISSGASGTQTLTFNNAGSASQSGGVIGGGTGTIAVAQTGAGTTTLSGANTYTGGTTLNAGTILLGSTTGLGAASNAALTFGSGSTGTLSLNGNSTTLTDVNTNATVGTPIIQDNNATAATLTVNTANTDTYAGVLQNGASGTLALIKSGAGSLKLSGANTYTGGTTLNAGTILLGSTTGLGAATNAALSFGASSTGTLSLNGNNTTLTDLNTNTTVGTPLIQDNNATAATLTVSTANTDTYAGVLQNGASGTLALIKSGAGSLILSGANTYSGGTTLSAGTLTLGNNSALGSAALNLNAGVLNNSAAVTITNSIVVGGTAAIQTGSANDLTLNGGISGSGSLTLGNSGDNQSLKIGGANTMTGGTITLANNTNAVRFTSSSAGNAAVAFVVNNTSANKDTLDFGTGTINFGSLTGSGTLQGNAGGTKTISAGNLGTSDLFSGTLNDGGGQIAFTKVGTGAQTFTGSSGYTGATTVENGALIAGASASASTNGPFGNASSAIALGDTTDLSVSDNPQLLIGGAFTVSRAITVGSATGANTSTYTIGGSTTSTGIFSGAIGLNQGLSVTQVSGGTLNLNSNISSNGGSETLTFNNVGAVSQSTGVISNGSGTVSLTQAGAGTTTIFGTNTYGGATLVSGGTLALGGSGSINGTSGITINGSGAEFLQTSSTAVTKPITLTQGVLDGTGTVGAVTVGNGTGGIVKNGNGTTTALNLSSLSFNGAGTITINEGSSTSTPALNISGALTTTPANGQVTLNVATGPVWALNTAYDIIGYGSFGGAPTNFTVGTIAGLATRQSGQLGDTSSGVGYITLTITGDNPVWSGANGGIWKQYAQNSATSATPSWALKVAHTTTDFWTGDQAEFDDTVNINGTTAAPTTTTVSIQGGNVTPTNVVFNNSSLNYTINSGDGSFITGGGFLTKNGTASVTINSANNYTGGTTVNNGTLTIGAGGALGASTGTLAVNNTNTGAGNATVVNLSTSAATTTGSLSGTIATPSSGTNTATINNGGQLFTVNQTSPGSYAGIIAGSGGFTLGSSSTNTLTLTGVNTYGGNTTISGTGSGLTIGGSGSLGSGSYAGNIDLGSGTTFTYASTAAQTLSGLISDSGALVQNGSGTLTLTHVNTYSGATTIGIGATLAITGTGSLGSGSYAGNITDNGALAMSSSANQTLSGLISGSTGSLSYTGGGTLTLSGNNSYGGGTTLTGTLVLNNGSGLGTGTVTLSGGTLQSNTSSPATLTNNIVVSPSTSNTIDITNSNNLFLNGGISGSGNLTLGGGTTTNAASIFINGPNTMTGGTITIPSTSGQNAVRIETASASNASVAWVFNQPVATRNSLDNGGTFAFGSMTGNGYVDINGGIISAGALGQNDLFSGVIESTGGFTKVGSGTMTLTGVNAYTGGTTISAGALQLGNGTSGNDGTIASTSGITDNATLIYDRFGALSSSLVISGSGAVAMTGTGSQTLTGANSYIGTTTVENGSLIAGASSLSSTNGAFGNASSAIVLGDANSLSHSYAPSLLIGGAFTVGRNVTVGSSTGSNSSTYTIGGSTNNNSTFSGNIALNQNLTVAQVTTTGSNALTISGVISSASSAQGVTFAGPGNIILTNTNTYSGATTVNLGATLQLGTGTTGQDGTITSSSGITDNGTLVYDRFGSLSSGVPISGSGAVTKLGTGTQTLTGANSYQGTTTITAGTLALGSGGSLYNGFTLAQSQVTSLVDNGTFDMSGSGNQNIGSLSGSGVVNLGSHSLTLTLSSSQPTTTFSGVIKTGGLGGGAGGGLNVSNGGTVIFSGATDSTFTGATTISNGSVVDYSGSGEFAQSSPIVVADGGNNSTLLLDNSVTSGSAGITLAGNGRSFGALESSTGNNVVNSAISLTGVNVAAVGIQTDTGSTLTLNGGISSQQAVTLYLTNNNTTSASTINGAISDGAGQISLNTFYNSGTWILASANGFTGGTTLAGGKVQLNNANALHNSDVSVQTTNGLTFNNTASGGSIYNLASLTDGGSGSGLLLSDINNAAVTVSEGSDNSSTTYGGSLSGLGGITKVGTGTMTLTGSNTNTGRTTVTNGELDLNSAGGAGNYAITGSGGNANTNPDVLVNGGALVTLASNQFAGTATVKVTSGLVNFNNTTQSLGDLYNAGGTVDYSGNITFSDPTWAGGTNTVSGGTTTAGTLNVSGGSNYVEGASYSGGAGELVAGNVGGVNFSGAGSPNVTLESDNGTPGILQLTGNVTADGASTATITSGNDNGAGSNAGEVDLNGANRTFTVSGTAKPGLEIDAPIVDSGTGGAITKAGTGVMTVTADNTYAGGTTVSGGTLYVDNTGGASYTAPITNPHAAITATNTTGSGTGSGAVTVQSGGTLAGSGTIASTSGGISVQNGGTLSSGAIQSGTTAGQGLTINNAANLSSALTVNGGATLSFALGSTTGYDGGSGALNFANPNTNSTFLSITGSTVDQIFSNTTTADNISLIDLTKGSTSVALTLRSQNPYLLIQTALGNNQDFSNLWTTGGEGVNGYVLGVSTGVGNAYTAFNLVAYDINGNQINTSSNLENMRLYLYNGDLEVVPEPGTWALMLGGLALLVLVQRRRKMN